MIKKNENYETLFSNFFTKTLVVYLICIIITMIFKTFFALTNGEEVFENFMLNLRPYLIGSFDKGDSIFASRYGDLGVFSVHYTILVSLIISYLLFIKISSSNSIYKNLNFFPLSVIMIIVGLILTITMYKNFFFCLPEAIMLSGIINLILVFIPYKTIEKNKKLLTTSYNIFIASISVIALFATFLPYIGE